MAIVERLSVPSLRGPNRGRLIEECPATRDPLGSICGSERIDHRVRRIRRERRIRPVGSDREIPVDVRVVSATQRDLSRLQEEGDFRADLFGRLAGLQVHLPGLCDRREEILGLFVEALGSDAPPLTRAAAEALLLHDWPYNVREVQQAAASARMFAAAVPAIGPSLRPAAVERSARQRQAGVDVSAESPHIARADLVRLLQAHGGNVASVGRSLGKTRQQIYRLMQLHRLDPEGFRA